jgi:hypothetical protein
MNRTESERLAEHILEKGEWMKYRTHKAHRFFDGDETAFLFKDRRCLGVISPDHRPVDDLRLTEDWDNVDCKNCLKHRPAELIPESLRAALGAQNAIKDVPAETTLERERLAAEWREQHTDEPVYAETASNPEDHDRNCEYDGKAWRCGQSCPVKPTKE